MIFIGIRFLKRNSKLFAKDLGDMYLLFLAGVLVLSLHER